MLFVFIVFLKVLMTDWLIYPCIRATLIKIATGGTGAQMKNVALFENAVYASCSNEIFRPIKPFQIQISHNVLYAFEKDDQYLGISSHYHRKILVKIISYLQGVADVYL